MLKYLPRSGMDFLFHIFDLSWTLHSFPSIWKTSSIIPIHKMDKSVDSPASFRPISLTSCVSKLFERIILSRLLFFLESNSIPSPRQAGFRPEPASLLALLVVLNLSFPIGALAWFIKITKVAPFESVEVFRKDPFLTLYFSLFINDLPASPPGPGELPGFWGSMVCRHAFIPRNGSGNNNNSFIYCKCQFR